MGSPGSYSFGDSRSIRGAVQLPRLPLLHPLGFWVTGSSSLGLLKKTLCSARGGQTAWGGRGELGGGWVAMSHVAAVQAWPELVLVASLAGELDGSLLGLLRYKA